MIASADRLKSLSASRFGEDVLIVVDLPHGSPRSVLQGFDDPQVMRR